MHHKRPKTNRDGDRAATTSGSANAFAQLFAAGLDWQQLQQLWQTHQQRRRPPRLPFADLLLALVYHGLMGAGSLEQHVAELTGQRLSGSALSQRRQRLNWKIFQQLMSTALRRRAETPRHPQAFYKGLRLLGVDGSRLAMTNTARLLQGFRKAVSRRMKAAFAQVQVVELGLHNPVAAQIGRDGESEMVLGLRLLERLAAGDLLLADRLYGVQKIAARLLTLVRQCGAQFLVRVRRNLQARVLEVLADGSALVEVVARDESGRKQKLTLREIQGVVRGRNGKRTAVRLWTSLLEVMQSPAAELLALYGQRWEVEITVKELKVEMRGRQDVLAAQTPETAAQEIAALLLALAVLVRGAMRSGAAGRGGGIARKFPADVAAGTGAVDAAGDWRRDPQREASAGVGGAHAGADRGAGHTGAASAELPAGSAPAGRLLAAPAAPPGMAGCDPSMRYYPQQENLNGIESRGYRISQTLSPNITSHTSRVRFLPKADSGDVNLPLPDAANVQILSFLLSNGSCCGR